MKLVADIMQTMNVKEVVQNLKVPAQKESAIAKPSKYSDNVLKSSTWIVNITTYCSIENHPALHTVFLATAMNILR